MHAYTRELGARDPMAEQPEAIRVDLKAHQKAALEKAIQMETMGYISYKADPVPFNRYREPRFQGHFKAYTNVGILGDLVGHGKTLTALSIIAATPTRNIYTNFEQWHSFMHPNVSGNRSNGTVRIVCELTDEEMAAKLAKDVKCATTLIVVPRGPVFTQWRNAVENQTRLKCLVIDTIKCVHAKMPAAPCSHDDLRDFFEAFDAVLIKSTTLKQLINHYTSGAVGMQWCPGFDRIIVDEAHDELGTIPMMQYKFLWLVTSTYSMMTYKTYSSSNYLSNGIRHITESELMSTFVIRGDDEFVRASFELPRMTEHTYICKVSLIVAAIQAFLAPNVQERLNINDIAGAVREMGGKAETEEELIRMLTSGMDRDINNKRRELDYINGLEMDENTRETTVTRLQGELRRLEEKRADLAERVTALEGKQCAICMDSYDEPVMLACTHVFCGQCVVDWMRARAHMEGRAAPACPTCRLAIDTKKMVVVVSEEDLAANAANVANAQAAAVEEDAGTNEGDVANVGKYKKEELLIRLLRRKPNGKWLIFTKADNGFVTLRQALQGAGISFAELKGNTHVMAHTLDNFRRGNLQVILLHTQYAGSGIDISCATDVIIYHRMGLSKIQAIGRAQRVGRSTPLTVHNLMYPNEIEAEAVQ